MKLVWDSASRVDKHDGGYHRQESDSLYHTARWAKLSRSWRQSHPLCEECKRKGIIKAAQCVDHIIPHPICSDFFDTSNLQSLCNECNMLKGMTDRKTIQQWRKTHPRQGGGGKNL